MRWRNGFGVYCFDLTRTTQEALFSVERNYQIDLSLESDYNWNCFLFFSQEKNITINNYSGKVDKDQLQQ